MTTPTFLRHSPLKLWILHLAFLTAVPLYFFIYRFVLLPTQPPQPEQILFSVGGKPFHLWSVLIIIALIQIPLGFMIDKLPIGGRITPDDSAQAYLDKRTFMLIVQDAFFESIAIYGLISIFLGAQPWVAYSLMGLSLFLLLLITNRVREWTEEFQRRQMREQH